MTKMHMLDRRWDEITGTNRGVADCGQQPAIRYITTDISEVTCAFCIRIYPSWGKRDDLRIPENRREEQHGALNGGKIPHNPKNAAIVAKFRQGYRDADTLWKQFDLLRAVMARMKQEDGEYIENRAAQELNALIIEAVQIFKEY